MENRVNGVWTWYPKGAYLVNNIIANNGVGVNVGAGSKPEFHTNNIWGNHQANVSGAAMSTSDMSVPPDFQDVSNGDIRLAKNSPLLSLGLEIPILHTTTIGVDFGAQQTIAHYKNLMNTLLTELVQDQPYVRYELTGDLGLFQVHVRFPLATFSVRSSTNDTEIREYDAYDTKTYSSLYSELVYQQFPTIIVRNASYEEQSKDRYALDSTYYHPGSYFKNEKNELVFTRETTFSRIEIEVPEGYVPIAVNSQATFEVENNRAIVKVENIGRTTVSVIMAERSPMVQDVYGVFEKGVSEPVNTGAVVTAPKPATITWNSSLHAAGK